ncbi:hypothetical protein ACFX13_030960 [Malus domestica]
MEDEALDYEASQLTFTKFGGGDIHWGWLGDGACSMAKIEMALRNSLMALVVSFMVLKGEGRTLLKLA